MSSLKATNGQDGQLQHPSPRERHPGPTSSTQGTHGGWAAVPALEALQPSPGHSAGKATMATGPSILPVVFGASGGSCHASPQHLWVKLCRRAGMTSGACELSPLARLPPEQPCLHSCGPAAPAQARTPAPAGPFRPRDGPWPAPSVGWSSPSLPPLLIPPQQRMGASGDRSHGHKEPESRLLHDLSTLCLSSRKAGHPRLLSGWERGL